jgi:acetyl-CoA/propionyl-CoA carboxylase biotin carboxyl carrier protein
VTERSYQVEVDGRLYGVKVIGDAAPAGVAAGSAAGLRRPPKRERGAGGAGGGGATEELVSPIQGSVLKVAVEQGAEVEEGALICVVEAMKMENEITAHRSGKLSALNVSEGGSVNTGDVIAVID